MKEIIERDPVIKEMDVVLSTQMVMNARLGLQRSLHFCPLASPICNCVLVFCSPVASFTLTVILK